MTDRWEPHADANRWVGDGPNLDAHGTRYVQPPLDPEGIVGPRHLRETTALTQTRYHGGPAFADLPGFLAFGGGPWYASFDGSRWCRIDAPGAVEPDFDGGEDDDDEQ